METEKKIFLEILNMKPSGFDLINVLHNYEVSDPKSAKASAEARKKGNDLFLMTKGFDAKTHREIFRHYCESIALAPMETEELALGYGNRSYFLLHMHKYEECIEDIDRALKMSIPDALKAKLLCRKAECKKRLGSDVSNILEMAKGLAETVDQNKIKILKMIDAVKALDVGTKKEGMSKSDQKTRADYNLTITDDFSSCVSIEYSEKYGRYLVAAKDYKPGDIIFVEKIYASAFVEGSSFLGCDHCQKHVWFSIPCNYCNWVMYCSESCKKEAWNEYHDVECSTITLLKEWLNTSWKEAVLPIRILIMGIKETGGISNLKKEIGLLGQCADDSDSPRDFLKNGELAMKSIRSVCHLVSSLPPHDALFEYTYAIPYILVSLTKYSKLKDDFNLEENENLEMNEDILFLGSLLIKLLAVLNVNAFAASHDNSVEFASEVDNEKFSMIEHFDRKRCLGIFFSLLNHSCFPSAEWCCTESNKIIIYALHPIKKNSQIFIRYHDGYENEPQSVRQAKLTKKYNFTCECQACVEDWPSIIKIAKDVDDRKLEADVVKDMAIGNFDYKAIQELAEVLKEEQQVDELHFQILLKSITQGMQWKQPSHMFCDMLTLLKQAFKSLYSPQPLLFNKCY